LVFLVELIAASDQPKWLKPLSECLFGRDFADVVTHNADVQNQVVLLARLAIDSYSGLSWSDREQAIAVCCRWEVTQQKLLWTHSNEVTKSLFLADREERVRIGQMFASAAREIGLQQLSLSGTQVSDVSPLAGLGQLELLNLRGTEVSDVGPLAGLTQLRSLDLSETWVTDVKPMSGLGQLRTLYLFNSPVSDVSPLAGLGQLQRLHLRSTKVSDVGPLAGLGKLEMLDLRDCTSLNDLTSLAGLENLREILLSHWQQVRVPKSLEKVIRRT
jgi:hypothetical protein